MSEVELRPVSADDIDFLFTLHRAAFKPYVEQIWGWDDDEQADYLRRTVDVDCVRVIVVDGVDGGRLDVKEDDDEVFLALIELLPAHQDRGIGSRLISELMARAFVDGKRVRLSVLEVNHAAHRLYQRLGFVETGRDGVAPEVRIRMVAYP